MPMGKKQPPQNHTSVLANERFQYHAVVYFNTALLKALTLIKFCAAIFARRSAVLEPSVECSTGQSRQQDLETTGLFCARVTGEAMWL